MSAMAQHPQPNFLLVTFPAQGHINPALEFAKRLINIGAQVTLVICVSARRLIPETKKIPQGLSLFTFSDGYDHGVKPTDDQELYMSHFKQLGSQALNDLIMENANGGGNNNPFTCLVYTLLLPWAAEVARANHLPSALLWLQPATVLGIYYHYFNGYGDAFGCCNKDPSYVLELPGLPPLTSRDLPSFFTPANIYATVLPIFQEQLEKLSEEPSPIALVNTFDALEPEALKSIEKMKMIGIGPLIPDSSSSSSGLSQSSEDYIEWLNSKPKSSVVYVSFGSIALLSGKQMEELARGLIDSGLPFLWVVRTDQNGKEDKDGSASTANTIFSTCRKELERKGMIVPWCSQLEVLSHPSLGCFLTHCGWNSTVESLVHGIPVVAFPQWTDQGTNAKLIEDVWKTGVRVVPNEEGTVDGNEIRRCLNLVMGGGRRAEEMKIDAQKWKDLAIDAMKEGGSSDINLKAFVHEVGAAAAAGCSF